MVLKDCSRCTVYTPQGKPLSRAEVVHTKDYIALYFEISGLQDVRMRTVVDFYDDRVGMIRAVCSLVVRRNPSFPAMPNPWMADCEILEVTAMPLDRNEKISFQYSFRTAMRTFQARVIRMQRIGDEYGYGCRFENLSENAEAVIREYVYKVLKEREKRKLQ